MKDSRHMTIQQYRLCLGPWFYWLPSFHQINCIRIIRSPSSSSKTSSVCFAVETATAIVEAQDGISCRTKPRRPVEEWQIVTTRNPLVWSTVNEDNGWQRVGHVVVLGERQNAIQTGA